MLIPERTWVDAVDRCGSGRSHTVEGQAPIEGVSDLARLDQRSSDQRAQFGVGHVRGGLCLYVNSSAFRY